MLITIDFLMLILCPRNLLILILLNSFEFYMYNQFICKLVFYFLFPNIYALKFFFLPNFTIYSTSGTILISSSGSGSPCLISSIRMKVFTISSVCVMFTISFSVLLNYWFTLSTSFTLFVILVLLYFNAFVRVQYMSVYFFVFLKIHLIEV